MKYLNQATPIIILNINGLSAASKHRNCQIGWNSKIQLYASYKYAL